MAERVERCGGIPSHSLSDVAGHLVEVEHQREPVEVSLRHLGGCLGRFHVTFASLRLDATACALRRLMPEPSLARHARRAASSFQSRSHRARATVKPEVQEPLGRGRSTPLASLPAGASGRRSGRRSGPRCPRDLPSRPPRVAQQQGSHDRRYRDLSASPRESESAPAGRPPTSAPGQDRENVDGSVLRFTQEEGLTFCARSHAARPSPPYPSPGFGWARALLLPHGASRTGRIEGTPSAAVCVAQRAP